MTASGEPPPSASSPKGAPTISASAPASPRVMRSELPVDSIKSRVISRTSTATRRPDSSAHSCCARGERGSPRFQDVFKGGGQHGSAPVRADPILRSTGGARRSWADFFSVRGRAARRETPRRATGLGGIVIPAARVDEKAIKRTQARQRHADVLAHVLVCCGDQGALLRIDEPAIECIQIGAVGRKETPGQTVLATRDIHEPPDDVFRNSLPGVGGERFS